MKLTKDQAKAMDEITKWYSSNCHEPHLLTGYAGTGKTTLMKEFIRSLSGKKIAVCAFTNKATKVIGKMCKESDLNVDVLTICQILDLKQNIDSKTGKMSFIPQKDWSPLVGLYDLVIFSETSMIGSELYGYIEQSAEQGTAYLFEGDRGQINPVNELDSPTFSIKSRSQLTEVVRYGELIGDVVTDLRNNVSRNNIPVFPNKVNDGNTEGIFSFSCNSWEQLIKKAFASYLDKDADSTRILAYTNARVKELNDLVRNQIFKSPSYFEIGERIVFQSPYPSERLTTSDEAVVEGVNESTYSIGGTRLDILKLDISWEDVDGDLNEGNIRVLHPNSQSKFNAMLKRVAAAREWKAYYRMKECFADINYAYALTVHKSQGSTFDDVFVDVNNIKVNRQTVERNRLLYTAMTRAKNRVFIAQD